MLRALLLLFATLSHAHPVRQIGPLPTVSDPLPFASLEALPESPEFPVSPQLPNFAPSPSIQLTFEPTDLPLLPSLPPLSPTQFPPDGEVTSQPSLLADPPSSPDEDPVGALGPNLGVSPLAPTITPSSAAPALSVSVVPSISPSTGLLTTPFIPVGPPPLEESPTVEETPTVGESPIVEESPPVELSPTPGETNGPVTVPTPQLSEDELTSSPSPEPIPTTEEPDIPDVSGTPEFTLSPQPLESPAVPQAPPPGPPALPTVPPNQRTPCFPASATVKLSDGTIKMMKHLSIGDQVHVGAGKFAKVHMFTHRDYNTWEIFIRLTTSSGRALRATGGHFVYVGDTLRPARDVRVGDKLPTGEGTWTTVTSIHQVAERGLYNPQLVEGGDIVVDGIRASVYTEAIKPVIAHAALLPLRMAFNVFGLTTQCADHGYPRIVPNALRSIVRSP